MAQSKRAARRAKRARRSGATTTTAAVNGDSAPAAKPAAAEPRGRPRQRHGGVQRPQAPWHPLPIAEALIVAGVAAISAGVLSGGPRRSAPVLIAGILAVAAGTCEVALREHLAGYRSHALLLSLFAAVLFHSAVVLVAGALIALPREVNLLLLVADAAIFFSLHRQLRIRYEAARGA